MLESTAINGMPLREVRKTPLFFVKSTSTIMKGEVKIMSLIYILVIMAATSVLLVDAITE